MALNKPKKIEGEALKAYAVRLLGGRALSVGELKAKLRLKAAKVALDRKVLADIAATDSPAFTELVKVAQDALKTKAAAKA